MCFISINSVSCIGKFNNHTCMDSYMVQMKILKMSRFDFKDKITVSARAIGPYGHVMHFKRACCNSLYLD